MYSFKHSKKISFLNITEIDGILNNSHLNAMAKVLPK